MFDLDRELCSCNNKSLGDVVALIKEHHITSLEALKEDLNIPVGDVCEACVEEGCQNDGFSLAMALSLVKQKRL